MKKLRVLGQHRISMANDKRDLLVHILYRLSILAVPTFRTTYVSSLKTYIRRVLGIALACEIRDARADTESRQMGMIMV